MPTPAQTAQACLQTYLLERFDDPIGVLPLAERAYACAVEMGDVRLQAECLVRVAWARQALNEVEGTLKIALEALSLARQHHLLTEEVLALDMMGIALHNLGHIPEAMHVFNQQLILAQHLEDPYLIGMTYADMSIVHVSANNPQKTLETALMGHALLTEEYNDGAEHYATLLTVGNAYKLLGQTQQAEAAYTRLITHSETRRRYRLLEVLARLGLIEMSIDRGDIAGAQAQLTAAEQRVIGFNLPWIHFNIALMQGGLCEAEGRQPAALRAYRHALELSRLHPMATAFITIARQIKSLLVRMGRYEEAFEVSIAIDDHLDSALERQMETRMNALRTVYEVEKAWEHAKTQQMRAESLQREIDLQRQTEEQRRVAERLQLEADSQRDLNRRKERVLERLSHEVRNPLAVINGSGESIERYHARMSPEQLVAHAQRITQQAQHISKLFDETLTVMTVEDAPTFPTPSEHA
jgi:tetratricopeptide (TPR) repeat protein